MTWRVRHPLNGNVFQTDSEERAAETAATWTKESGERVEPTKVVTGD